MSEPPRNEPATSAPGTSGSDPSDAERALAFLSAHAAARTMGVALVEASPGRAVVRMVVVDSMVNAHGICHGGVVFTLADLAGSIAVGGTSPGSAARGASIELLNPAPMGAVLEASASVTYARGRSAIVDVAVATADGTLVSLLRGRVGGRRPAPAPSTDA